MLQYKAFKAISDNGKGDYFHNSDMGHPVYVAGSKGYDDNTWDYADNPSRNVLYKNLSKICTELKKSGFEVKSYTWWYDFTGWQSFCAYVVTAYRNYRGYE